MYKVSPGWGRFSYCGWRSLEPLETNTGNSQPYYTLCLIPPAFCRGYCCASVPGNMTEGILPIAGRGQLKAGP